MSLSQLLYYLICHLLSHLIKLLINKSVINQLGSQILVQGVSLAIGPKVFLITFKVIDVI
jgi:hypothetical protein